MVAAALDRLEERIRELEIRSEKVFRVKLHALANATKSPN
jgi:hypothetical protein